MLAENRHHDLCGDQSFRVLNKIKKSNPPKPKKDLVSFVGDAARVLIETTIAPSAARYARCHAQKPHRPAHLAAASKVCPGSWPSCPRNTRPPCVLKSERRGVLHQGARCTDLKTSAKSVLSGFDPCANKDVQTPPRR